ncbi:recombinase family protein [Sinomonas sp. ASV486]|uniref:recombinase family protein n=1 Tax=Sinomonas sp. ASV486 TaxID=3051170 RepID=UPI0027DE62BD|nr:recombinase family protein [Sinomonas sp. ASV486]MDQ4490710.1 recombinase family protein [Sinomonas sp. ASV486]
MAQPTAAAAAAVYCRISSDPEGKALGVERQEADCRALAARLGLEVARVFVENDTGASTKSRKARPRYEELIKGVRAGLFGVILAYSNSRLTRRPLEWEALIRLHDETGVLIRTVVSGQYDLSTADGRALARTVAAWDAAEAERTAERVARAKADNVARGEWRGGRRPFGYEADGVTVRPDEAEALERAADAIVSGSSLASAARDMRAAGITTSSKKAQPMTPIALRSLLLRPRNAGLMEAGGKITGKASWPAIIPEDKWYAVRSILTDPKRRTQYGSDVRWLGGGLFRCGVCGARVRSAATSGTGRTVRRIYRCSTGPHLTRDMPQTDAYVNAVIAARLRAPDVRERILTRRSQQRPHRADLEKLRADLRGYRERLSGLGDDYALGLLDGQQVHAATARLDGLIEDAEQKLSAAADGDVLSEAMNAADPGQWYLDAPVNRQRGMIDALATVTIEPAPRGRPKGHIPGNPYFNPDYIRVDWK